jgi:hypothetical protein
MSTWNIRDRSAALDKRLLLAVALLGVIGLVVWLGIASPRIARRVGMSWETHARRADASGELIGRCKQDIRSHLGSPDVEVRRLWIYRVCLGYSLGFSWVTDIALFVYFDDGELCARTKLDHIAREDVFDVVREDYIRDYR